MARLEEAPGAGNNEDRADGAVGPSAGDDLTGLNTARLILDSVGAALLADIVREFLHPLGACCTVHERNGDYALRIMSSAWCQFLDAASRRLCGGVDSAEALACGSWHCHHSHSQEARRAIETARPANVECRGGIRILAVPILFNGETLGSITLGYGEPRRESQALAALAGTFHVPVEDLLARAEACPAPPLDLQFATRRLVSAARFIAEIVARARAESALAESERRFAAFMHHLPAAAFIKDQSGRVLFANRFLAQLFGWESTEGKTTSELLSPDMAEPMTADDRRVLAEGRPMVIQERIRDANGSERYFDTYKFPVAADQGILLGGVALESTGRRRAEEALRTSESFLSTIIDGSPYPMWISDRDGTLVRINQSLRDLLHVTDADVVGRYNILRDNIVEEQGLMPLVKRVYEEGQPVRFEIDWDGARLDHVKWPGAARVTLDVSVFPIRDAAGRITNAVIQHVDITDRKRAEKALRESERRYRELLQNVHLVAVMLDLDGRIDFCNDFFLTQTGWLREEVVGRMFADLVAPESQGLLARLTESAEQAGPVEGALLSRSGPPRWIQWNSAVLRNPAGEITGLAGLGVDVTDHRTLQEQYLQSQKLESVGRLAGGIAHDFNNLLTVIRGYGSLVMNQVGGDTRLRARITEILKASERAAGLTAQLLAFSRKQVSQPRPLDVNGLLTESQEMLQRLVGEDVEVTVHLSPNTAWVMADPGQLHQVLMNLVVNARDAMPGGGRLVLETMPVDLDADFSALHPEVAPGPYLRLAVTDTGIGMDEQTRQHLFEPFFTTKEKGQGTGLGLSTVYGIVRQSRGWVCARSEPGKGSTFEVFLPRAAASPDREGPDRSHPGQPAAGPLGTVLVVEDQAQVRALAADALKSCGCLVLEADCAEAALRLSENYPETIHLLLTDVVMPGMNGKELADRLMAARPGLDVIYMSGYAESAILSRVAGVEYLPKPFSLERLASKVSEVLNRRSSI